jgi:hypothetical protein
MKRILAALMITFLAMPLPALDPERFVQVWTLDADAAEGVARVRIDPDMQSVMTDPGLADLAISDASDQRVPFALVAPHDLVESLSRREVLDYTESTVADADTPETSGDSPLRLELLQDGRRLVMTIPRGQPDADTRRPPVLEALIGAPDMSEELPDRMLELRLQSMTATRLDCRIRNADDPDEPERRLGLLDRGERHPYRYSGSLDIGQLPRAWHLRCFADAVPEGLRMEQAFLLAQGRQDHRQVQTFHREIKAGEPLSELSLPGAYRVRSIEVKTEGANVLADLVVSARNHSDQPWQRLGRGVLSTLPGEAPGANRLELDHRERFRYWQVQVEPAPGRSVRVEFSTEVEEVVFLPQGQGPWRLYAGSRRLDRSPDNRELVERTIQRLGQAWQWPLTAVSGPGEAGGASALELPSEPLPWRRIVLWAVLGLAALILIWISIHLLRQAA